MWSKSFAGPNFEVSTGLASDANGNVVVTGYFQNTLAMGGPVLSSAGGQDIFVGKFSGAGAYLWSERFGGAGSESSAGIATDSNGYVIGTGLFQGTVDFGGQSLTSSGSFDIYLLRLDP
jgi:hypothetical protein